MKALADFLNQENITNQNGKQFSPGMIHRLLHNPFYYGSFQYKSELHEGKHEPIITKRLFDKVQNMLKQRGRKVHEMKKHNYAFADGFMRCPCGCMITAERQKEHIYYRCTKKKGPCPEKYLREHLLVEQIRDFLHSISLPDSWEEKWLTQLDIEKAKAGKESKSRITTLKSQILSQQSKLDKLLDAHLEDAVDKEPYLAKKENLLSEKITLEEKIQQIRTKGSDWLEPMRDFILQLKKAKKIATDDDFSQYPSFLKNAGSNFILEGRKLRFQAKKPYLEVAKISPRSTVLPIRVQNCEE